MAVGKFICSPSPTPHDARVDFLQIEPALHLRRDLDVFGRAFALDLPGGRSCSRPRCARAHLRSIARKPLRASAKRAHLDVARADARERGDPSGDVFGELGLHQAVERIDDVALVVEANRSDLYDLEGEFIASAFRRGVEFEIDDDVLLVCAHAGLPDPRFSRWYSRGGTERVPQDGLLGRFRTERGAEPFVLETG